MTIYFDMDGTIADLYNVTDWLDKLLAHDPSPYALAAPLIRLCTLARVLNNLKLHGFQVGIVSWLSKDNDPVYNQQVTETKIAWINKHLPSVEFDEIKIVPYGTPKSTVVDDPSGILFDDEENNRKEWSGTAFDTHDIINTLKGLK